MIPIIIIMMVLMMVMGFLTNKKVLLILAIIMVFIAYSTYQFLDKIGLGWLFTGSLSFIFENIILLPFKILRNIITGG